MMSHHFCPGEVPGGEELSGNKQATEMVGIEKERIPLLVDSSFADASQGSRVPGQQIRGSS